MVYIGIDPGQKGGIAIIDKDGAEAHPYSNDKLRDVCENVYPKSCVCFVEKVASMPGQGVSSTFNFGQSFGYILGVLESHYIPYQLISPRKWKNHYGLDSDKSKSIEMAKRLFPTVSLFPTGRCKKENDGMAESLLIALYAKRISGEANTHGE